MAMTIGEAREVQNLVAWVLALRTFEPGFDDFEDELIEALGFLTDRARAVMMAGPTRTEVEDQARALLGARPADSSTVASVGVR